MGQRSARPDAAIPQQDEFTNSLDRNNEEFWTYTEDELRENADRGDQESFEDRGGQHYESQYDRRESHEFTDRYDGDYSPRKPPNGRSDALRGQPNRGCGGSTVWSVVIAVAGIAVLAAGIAMFIVARRNNDKGTEGVNNNALVEQYEERLKQADLKAADTIKRATTSRMFQILHFNDNYQIEEYNITTNTGAKVRTGGMSRLQTLKNMYSDALVVFSGDTLFPSALSSIFNGEQMIDTMNFLGVDVATIGNHEFDKGMDNWATMRDKSNFTWIIANFVDKGMGASGSFSKLKKNMIIRKNNVSVGFFGLASDWRSMTSVDADFLDIVTTSKQQVADLKSQGAEFIVAVTHNSQSDDELMAARVPGIDLILGGHDHDLVTNTQVNNVIIWKSQSDLVHAGLFNISMLRDNNNSTFARILPVTLNLNEMEVKEDSAMKQRVLSWVNRLASSAQYVGTVVQELNTADVRAKETNAGNYLADSLVWEVQTKRATELAANPNIRVVGIFNSGNIRGTNVAVGNFTNVRMLALLPFDNIACCRRVNGSILRAAMENGVSAYPQPWGKFPQVSGFTFTFDPSKPAGSRVLSMNYTDGTELKGDDVLYVGMLNYLFDGGDNYVWGTGGEIIRPNEGRNMRECVTDFTKVKLNYNIDYATYGRIVFKSSKLSVLEEVLSQYAYEDVIAMAGKLQTERRRRRVM